MYSVRLALKVTNFSSQSLSRSGTQPHKYKNLDAFKTCPLGPAAIPNVTRFHEIARSSKPWQAAQGWSMRFRRREANGASRPR